VVWRQLQIEQHRSAPPLWPLLRPVERGWWVRRADLACSGLVPREIYETWCAEMLAAGWRAGPAVDHAAKTHPFLAGWGELPDEYRSLFYVLQMTAVSMTLFIHPFLGQDTCVTALLSGIAWQWMVARDMRAISLLIALQRLPPQEGQAMSHATPPPEHLLTPAEVAALFRVDPKTVTRWAQAGKIRAIRTLGGHRRYNEAEVRALLQPADAAQAPAA